MNTLMMAVAMLAAVRMDAPFSDHMVLQAGQAIPVTGCGAGSDKLSCTFAGKTVWTYGVGDTGKFRFMLPPLPAGGPHELVISNLVKGMEMHVVRDVMVGEVWIAAGQSNMQWAMKDCKEQYAATNELVRIFRKDKWVVATAEDVRDQTAEGFWFAETLQRKRGGAIGLLSVAVGGTYVVNWMSHGAAKGCPEAKVLVEDYEHHQDDANRWKQPIFFEFDQPKRGELEKNPPPKEKRTPGANVWGDDAPWSRIYRYDVHCNQRPSFWYDYWIRRLVEFPVRGAFWHQGESEAMAAKAVADGYAGMLKALIADWRHQWGMPEMPFCIVQIHDFDIGPRDAAKWKTVQDAQLAVSREVAHCGFVRTADVGTRGNIHFPDKRPVGERLAAWALADVYGVENPSVVPWRPAERWCGFNLLGMFCQTKMANGDKRVLGYFPEDRFRWMREWGFNFARLPLDYRFFVKDGDWMKPDEAQLKKLDEAVRLGRENGIHVQINFHRAPGYCCNAPQEPQSLFRDREPLVAFTNLWGVLARRYRGIPNEALSFDLLNEPAPVAFYGVTPSNYAVVARAALAAIRAVDPGRFVMSDGWSWGNVPVQELHPFDGASGESIHCYEPHGFTHFRAFNPDEKGPCPPWPPAGWTDGVAWLEKNYVPNWQPAIDDGTFLFVGEFACHQANVPHAAYLVWLEDVLKLCRRHGWGWALWNLDGAFGILDTPRTDCEMEDFHGHKLDRKALDLLIKYK